jgi:hypothetical protein
MVGDRLDTDIDGAVKAECDSLLVMTGVTGLEQLVAVPAGRRPTYIAPELSGLLEPHPRPRETPGGWELGGWTARVEAAGLAVEGAGRPGDWWRVVAAAGWAHLDRADGPADTSGLEPPRPG